MSVQPHLEAGSACGNWRGKQRMFTVLQAMSAYQVNPHFGGHTCGVHQGDWRPAQGAQIH
eukprot:scaffold129936_cov19-Tisochrysis_lutea.AAC.1